MHAGGTDTNCLDNMKFAMQQTIAAMQTGGVVPMERLNESQALMTQLFDGLVALSKQCQQHHQQSQLPQNFVNATTGSGSASPILHEAATNMEEDTLSPHPVEMMPITSTSITPEGILQMLGAHPPQIQQMLSAQMAMELGSPGTIGGA